MTPIENVSGYQLPQSCSEAEKAIGGIAKLLESGKIVIKERGRDKRYYGGHYYEGWGFPLCGKYLNTSGGLLIEKGWSDDSFYSFMVALSPRIINGEVDSPVFNKLGYKAVLDRSGSVINFSASQGKETIKLRICNPKVSGFFSERELLTIIALALLPFDSLKKVESQGLVLINRSSLREVDDAICLFPGDKFRPKKGTGDLFVLDVPDCPTGRVMHPNEEKAVLKRMIPHVKPAVILFSH